MTELCVERKVRARIPIADGEFHLHLYSNNLDTKEHLALVMGNVEGKSDVLVRIHSECFTGDVLGSMRCDCGEQLQRAVQQIAARGEGVLIYLRQEGRGIGLLDKLRAYNLQDEGLDTVDANLVLGHQADERDYTVAACIIEELGVRSVRLLTNNPAKISHLRDLGVRVTRRMPLEPTLNTQNAGYLSTKVHRMHHLLNLDRLTVGGSQDGNGSGTGPG